MKANQFLFVSIAAAAGCGVVNQPGTAPGDDAMGSGSDSGSGSGSGSDVNQDPPGSHPPGTIYGHIKDERGDTIDFSSGQPVHSHVGVSIDLSGSCPDVYKYAYLASHQLPAFGRELTPNPLAFHVEAPDATESAYRVRTDDGKTLLDWAPMSPDGDGVFTMELHRDDSTLMAALGTYVGKMYIDARFTDAMGTTIDTGCWVNHPLAAPLQVAPLANGALFGMTLPAASPISPVLNVGGWAFQTPAMDIATLPIVQVTHEPATITIAAPTPTGTGMSMGADVYLVASTTAVNLSCGPNVYDAGCNHVVTQAMTTTSTSGPLDGAWTLRVVDDATNSVLCWQPISDLTVTCTLPARAIGEQPHGYHAVLSLSSASIEPYSGTYGEFSVGAQHYTGTAPIISSGCSKTMIRTIGGVQYTDCTQSQTVGHVQLLDSAQINFDAINLSMTSNVGEPAMPALPSLVLPAQSWSAGNAGF